MQKDTELWIQATEPTAGTTWIIMLLSHRYSFTGVCLSFAWNMPGSGLFFKFKTKLSKT